MELITHTIFKNCKNFQSTEIIIHVINGWCYGVCCCVGPFLFCAFQSGPLSAGEHHHIIIASGQAQHGRQLFTIGHQGLYSAFVLS